MYIPCAKSLVEKDKEPSAAEALNVLTTLPTVLMIYILAMPFGKEEN